MNLSEMESKVREATNNEPWGASTSLMAQIAAGTYNYREREEILSFIFRRFTEKAANEWRQIYKSLQLLDYLIKNGLERIIDDVRANASLIQMLKSFHYIDSKGRDQGVNVRNRSKNLLALLNDDALVRLERKKARANAKKFGGVSSAAFGGASSIAVADGFGGDDDFTGRVYGDGGVYGARYDDPASAYDNGTSGRDNFEEYDETAHARPTTGLSKVHATAKNKAQPQAPEADLLGDLEEPSATNVAADDDDDDFDDFQTAPLSTSNTAGVSNLSSNLASLYVTQPRTQQGVGSFPQVVQQPYAPSAVNTYGPTSTGFSNNGLGNSGLGSTGLSNVGAGSGAGTTKQADAFSSLFSSAKTKTKAKDDGFGSFSSNSATPAAAAVPAAVPSTAPAQTQSQPSASGEIDLLSF